MRILLLSYYAPPLNSIAALRAYTLGQQLSKTEEVHLVTRFWQGNENSWEDSLESTTNSTTRKEGNLNIHYQAYQKPKFKQNRFLRKFATFKQFLRNDIIRDIDTSQFYAYSKSLLERKGFDAIFVTAPPVNIIGLGNKLAAEFSLPLFADFRDLHNSITLKKDLQLKLADKLELYILKRYLKRHLNQANLITTASEPFTEFLEKMKFTNVTTILNGFERTTFEGLKGKGSKRFEVTLIGTLYPEQNIDLLLQSFKLFLAQKSTEDVHINFIGVDSIKSVGDIIRKELPSQYITVEKKIERQKALQIAKDSQLLFYAGWKGFKGVYSGKIFEYLGLKRNILICPGDDDVLDKLVQRTNSGKITNSVEETVTVMEAWFKEWRENGALAYAGKSIDEYSREAQFQKLIKFIKNVDPQSKSKEKL